MRARLLAALLYPLGLLVGPAPAADAAIGRWCGSGPNPVVPSRHDAESLACHTILPGERKGPRARKGAFPKASV